MSYITAQEAAEKWGISERLVRRYCAQDRIPGLLNYDGIWQIPEDNQKPEKKKAPQLPKLLRTLIKQRNDKQYRGLYDYLQINRIYSNGRMASKRLPHDQIEVTRPTAYSRTLNPSRSTTLLKCETTFSAWTWRCPIP